MVEKLNVGGGEPELPERIYLRRDPMSRLGVGAVISPNPEPDYNLEYVRADLTRAPQPATSPSDDVSDDPREKGCRCQRCGTRYRVDINVSDDLWAKIHGNENLLCGPCVIGSVELLGKLDYFYLTKPDAPQPLPSDEASGLVKQDGGVQSDEVKLRARKAAEEIVASVSVNDFRNIQNFNRYDRLTSVVLKHFTASDVD